ncbi:hypothetical protein SAMN06265784_101484 [Paraburkholderia susongensis]|uniref:Uncharacterized protein n=1 Tax=Paraburkholderia susongensis TaxID=1515439 RepID=A0A1X7IA40_9BURK|nr:hypothetical protein SAMN06265784_101484 [Paraburkholderia susongensis]
MTRFQNTLVPGDGIRNGAVQTFIREVEPALSEL